MPAKTLIAAALLCIASAGFGTGEAAPRPAIDGIAPSNVIAVAARSRGVRRRVRNTSAATWQMPWQIRPIGSRAGRERIVEAFVPRTGRVRGTRAAIATIGQPLRPARGRNRTVRACRAVVASEAAKFGAREVEAASAGRERRTASRTYAAPVKFRITYKVGRRYDVRVTTLRCVVDRRGTLVNAYVPKRRLKHRLGGRRHRSARRHG